MDRRGQPGGARSPAWELAGEPRPASARISIPKSPRHAGPWFRPTRRSAELAARYQQWKRTARNGQIFSAIAIAQPQLRRLNLETGAFETTGWPAEWNAIRERRRGPPGPPPEDEGLAFELPLFGKPPRGAPSTSLIFELNLPYVRDVILPELIERHLGSDYQVEVVTRAIQPSVIYQSDPAAPQPTAVTADASVGLFEVQFDRIFRPEEPPGGGGGRGPGGGPGRWRMLVRHRSGSLETVVAQARWRNLAVTAGVLLLMVASVAALVRFTRRAQKLAELQMDFVAGVSHELRTPLAVIHTAAYNLRGGGGPGPQPGGTIWSPDSAGKRPAQGNGGADDAIRRREGRLCHPGTRAAVGRGPRRGRLSPNPSASSRRGSIPGFLPYWAIPWRSNTRFKT